MDTRLITCSSGGSSNQRRRSIEASDIAEWEDAIEDEGAAVDVDPPCAVPALSVRLPRMKCRNASLEGVAGTALPRTALLHSAAVQWEPQRLGAAQVLHGWAHRLEPEGAAAALLPGMPGAGGRG